MKNYLVRVTKEVTDYLVVNADNENVAHFIAEGFAEGRIDVNDPHFKEYMRNIGFNYVPKEISIEDSSDGTLKDCVKDFREFFIEDPDFYDIPDNTDWTITPDNLE
ncbi:MAG: hypothetical protein MJ168_09480 [Clostridia bacterium]|nr:hypothetical protein [Clostridia bacterium]